MAKINKNETVIADKMEIGEEMVFPRGEVGGILDGDILTEPEAADFLKVSQGSLARWRNQGVLSFYRPGGYRLLYSKSKHLLPFLESCEQGARAT